MSATAPYAETSASSLSWLKRARIDLQQAFIITRREVRDMFRDWRIIAPTVILTLVFPAIANWGAGRMIGFVAQYGADPIGDRLVPFLLMVVGFFPMSFSLIIALETFVGEKERRSLEPLLATPLSNTQLYIGKMLSSLIPPLLGSMLGISVYLVGIYINIQWLPQLELLALIVLLNVVQAMVMVAAAVVVSSQTTSVRAANLLASFIIVPMAFLIQAEAFIMFWAQYSVLWLMVLALLVVLILLIRMGTHIFNREELLGSEIDQLNLLHTVRQWWKLTWQPEPGQKVSPLRWYQTHVLKVVWNMRGAVAVILIALLGAWFVGIRFSEIYTIPRDLFDPSGFGERFQQALVDTGLTGTGGVARIWWQNVRALALASVLAVFSFGVLAILTLMLPFVIIGFLFVQLGASGLDPLTPWVALAPHAVIEIPAALIAGAAALRLGAAVIAPPPGRSVGEAWVEALADASRLWFMLILPLLLIAAVAEVYLTPYLVGLVLGI